MRDMDQTRRHFTGSYTKLQLILYHPAGCCGLIVLSLSVDSVCLTLVCSNILNQIPTFRPSSTGLDHILVVACDFTQILMERSSWRWVNSQATNAWSRPIRAGRNIGIRNSFCKFCSKVSPFFTIIFILGAMNDIFQQCLSFSEDVIKMVRRSIYSVCSYSTTIQSCVLSWTHGRSRLTCI